MNAKCVQGKEIMAENKINWQPEILESEILKIVPLNESDFENLFELASDPLIWEQHPTKDRYKREVFQLYFDGAILGNTSFKIIDKSTNKSIGSTRYYDYNPEKKSIAIGFTFLVRQYWGGLYNKSSKKLLIEYAFRFVDKVYFHIGGSNIRSQLAITKIGAVKVKEFESAINGKNIKYFEYLIEKKNWNDY
jgi:RimJ/RimL family protein N-acetyltransferase